MFIFLCAIATLIILINAGFKVFLVFIVVGGFGLAVSGLISGAQRPNKPKPKKRHF